VDNSILLNDVDVGRHSRVRNAIIDAGVRIPEGSLIGYDLEKDRAVGCHVTEGGIVVVPCRQETYATIAV
jgi:glucose-1-phosphate adenylyltransferase